MVLSLLVKFSIVKSLLKISIELMNAHKSISSVVKVHIPVLNAMVLGLVLMLMNGLLLS
jgi:hypothetical protein